MTITEMQQKAHENSRAKGWWQEAEVNAELVPRAVREEIPKKLCLIHSEVSEALESYRNDEPLLWVPAGTVKPEGIAAELADVVIRVGDLCDALGIDLQAAIEQKMAYNATRPHRHGGKRA